MSKFLKYRFKIFQLIRELNLDLEMESKGFTDSPEEIELCSICFRCQVTPPAAAFMLRHLFHNYKQIK